jgi:hypothetical protein
MNVADLLIDGFGRVDEEVRDVVAGLSPDQLAVRPDPGANSIGWLVWHLLRVQDDHVAGAVERDQVWTSLGWARRFDLPYDDGAIGFGQSSEEVGQLLVDEELLVGYLEAVHARTLEIVAALTPDDLERVVDTRWDPGVTLGVRLVSVLSDDLQHVGQAAYVRGLVERGEGA